MNREKHKACENADTHARAAAPRRIERSLCVSLREAHPTMAGSSYEGDDVLRFWTQPISEGRHSLELPPSSPAPQSPPGLCTAWSSPMTSFPILLGTVITPPPQDQSEPLAPMKVTPPSRPPPPLFDAKPAAAAAEPPKSTPRTLNRTRVASLKVREAAEAEDLHTPPLLTKTPPAAASHSTDDEDDPAVAARRHSNRESARRVRQRKAAQLEEVTGALAEAIRERDEARLARAVAEAALARVMSALARVQAAVADAVAPPAPPAASAPEASPLSAKRAHR